MKLTQDIMKEVNIAIKAVYGKNSDSPLPLEIPPNPNFGDFAVPTFLLKKEFDEESEKIAEKIAETISINGLIESATAIGSYINICLGKSFFKASTENLQQKKPNGKHAMIEYLSPNTNKPLHLGHLRNGVLGVAMSNILKQAGYEVTTANLINDRGIHICKSMLAWQKWGENTTPESTKRKGDHFVGDFYVMFDKFYQEEQLALIEEKGMNKKEAKNNAPILLAAQEMLRKWEEKDPEIINLWQKMNSWVYDGFSKTYKNARFPFNVFMYESETYKLGKNVIEEGIKKGVFKKSDSGATTFELAEKKFGRNKDGTLKKITVLRKDGTSVYMTQDIGTALQKITDYNLDASIYVVGDEQNNHFDCLFEILEALGYDWSKNCYHLSYGMVNLPSGRMKSREGTSVDADNLIEDMQKLAMQEIKKRDPEGKIPENEVLIKAREIGLGAIKFYLAKTSPRQKLLFNPEESISFEGVTGPYCQYAYARTQSIIAKTPDKWIDSSTTVDYNLLGNHQTERILAQKLVLFEVKLDKAVGDYNPSIIANAVYDLAKAFNQWYNKCRIIDHDNMELSRARLSLIKATASRIKKGLGLLDINCLSKM
jgi:arginyl-tRNA synthetase